MARKFAGVSGSVAGAIQALKAAVSANATGVANNASAIAALGSPVRYDAAQSLTGTMVARVLANLGVTYIIQASGYINLFGVLILQWGSINTSTAGTGTWTYPTTFPNGVFRSFGTTTASQGSTVSITSKSNSSLTYNSYNAYNGSVYNQSIDFFVIGY